MANLMFPSTGASSSSWIEPKFGESVPWPGLETDLAEWPKIGSSWEDGAGERLRLFTRCGDKTLRIIHQNRKFVQVGKELKIYEDEFLAIQKKLEVPKAIWGLSATTAAAAPVTPKRSAAPNRVALPKPPASTRRQSAEKIDKAKKDLLEGKRKKPDRQT